MRFPEFLPEGGTIGFVAPSFGCATEPYKTAFVNAQEKFAALGYKSDLGPNCYAEKGIGISNTPQECGRELTDYYCSGANDVLISCGGGELMCETMDCVDFERIRAAKPKWYMGYSDNTNMTFLLTTMCDIASVYGPCASDFGMEPWHESIADALDVLSGKKRMLSGYPLWQRDDAKGRDAEHPFAPYNVTEPRKLVSYPAPSVKMRGRLLGGCVDCLVNLCGTKYDFVRQFNEKYKDDGIIWFLECCDLNVMGIRRALWELKNAGWFSVARGFLFGRPLCFGQELMGLTHHSAVTGILGDLNVPIIMDADVGHLSPMMPLVCGSLAAVRADGDELAVEMEYR